MKTSTKIIVDKYAGSAVVFVLKNIFRLFGTNRLTDSPKTIVVCKFLGMGSIVQSTPLIQSLKNKFPAAKIIYFTSISNKAFVDQLSIVDQSLIIDDRSFFSIVKSTLTSCYFLLSNKVHVFIDLELHSHYSKIFTISSRAPIRLGIATDSDKTPTIYTSNFKLHIDRPVSESYLEMCNSFEPIVITHDLYSFRSNEDLKEMLTKKFQIDRPYIIINPNASDLRIERRWPKENFSELIGKISNTFPNHQIVLIGSSSETEYVGDLFARIPKVAQKNVINTAGKLKIEELIQLTHGATLMVTNDTGPMHLAFAVECPTIALFGPASPIQFGNHKHVSAIYKKVACSPCVHDHIKPPCAGENICMKQIIVDEVFHHVQAAIVNEVQQLAK